MFRIFSSNIVLLLTAVLISGCGPGGFKVGEFAPNQISSPSGDRSSDFSSTLPGAPPANAPKVYQTATIRRLSNVEIINSIQDVFMGGAALTSGLLPQQTVRNGFDNQIAALEVTTPFMGALQQVAEQASAYVAQNLATLLKCDKSQASCISSYISSTGRRAFRRPLSAEELASYTALYNGRVAADGANVALGAVVESFIQSPFFLYRTELGAANGTDKVMTLTPFETAAALSYFILSSAPDDALLDAAAANQLATPAQRAAQAQRLLALPGARRGVGNFMLQWAQVLDAQTLTGTFGSSYPAFTNAAASAALTETQTFFEKEIFSGSADWKNFFLSKTGYMNTTLASIYGINASGATNTNFVAVTLDPTQRSGFLTQSSFIASHSGSAGFSPVHLGLYVSQQLFCNQISPPPPNIPALMPDPTGILSPRDRFANHLTSPVCNSCHSQFDPMGWAYEQYTPVGQFKPVQGNYTLTGAAALVGSDVNGSFNGTPPMSSLISQSKKAQLCFTAKLYEYALGRKRVDNSVASTIFDASVANSAAQFSADNTNVLNLIKSIVQSDAFVMRDVSSLPVNGGAP